MHFSFGKPDIVRPAILMLLLLLSACAPSVGPNGNSGSVRSAGRGTQSSSPMISVPRVSEDEKIRREAILRELQRLKQERESSRVSIFGVEVPTFKLSFSQLTRGLQPKDTPIDTLTSPVPQLDFPRLPDEPAVETASSTTAPSEPQEAILDERTLMLLAEAERMQTSLEEPLLADLARGSLSVEAFDQWSKQLRDERRSRQIVFILVGLCVAVLVIAAFFVINHFVEEFRLSQLPRFGQRGD